MSDPLGVEARRYVVLEPMIHPSHSYQEGSMPTPRDSITQSLDELVEHGFIVAWRKEGACWVVDAGTQFGPYTATRVLAFIDGCNAMGAGG